MGLTRSKEKLFRWGALSDKIWTEAFPERKSLVFTNSCASGGDAAVSAHAAMAGHAERASLCREGGCCAERRVCLEQGCCLSERALALSFVS